MKRLLALFAVGVLLFGVTTASTGDLRDWMDTLNDEIPFGYAVNQKISISQIAVNSVTIQSPVIEDEFGNQIKKYTVMFSQYPLSQILENTALINQSKEKTFEFTTVGTAVNMQLTSLNDGINPNVVYYASIMPKDQNGVRGEMSNNELRFKLATQTYGEGAPATGSDVHAAGGANMSLANVTCPVTQNRAVCRWTSIDGSDKVDIFLFNPTSEVFERLAIVNMSTETYTFTLTRNGEHILRFMPNNGGTEYDYTFVAEGITAGTTPTTPTTKPVIGKLPATGPKENILIALAIACVLYFVYRKTKAKAKH